MYTTVQTNFGLVVNLVFNDTLYIHLYNTGFPSDESAMMGHTSGLCGNFDNDLNNDLVTRKGASGDEDEVIRSWLILDPEDPS